jgi:hypothetical protein
MAIPVDIPENNKTGVKDTLPVSRSEHMLKRASAF